ncbi:MAG: diguanylate cyclase domain-containing protein [Alcanivoracaceae bacterium]
MTTEHHDIERDSAFYKTLLESTKAIPWRIDWETMKFTYIGPQIEALLGWTPESWVSIDDWVERMHPDDRDYVVNFCVSQSQSGVDHEADYRALTRDGGYIWIRDVVHVVRQGDQVEALVGFMFDISERKQNEEALLRLQRDLEELSYRDGLTEIPNRRMFDVVLEREWANARRSGRPLSVILLDIDYFKEFNDHYGHLAGDEALKKVAQVLGRSAGRPRDFAARFGGEEFVLVLPETNAEAAELIAERCRCLVLEEVIPHHRSKADPYLSISLGVGTIVPTVTDDPKVFIDSVDKLLYRAKQRGRNCAEYSRQTDTAPGSV